MKTLYREPELEIIWFEEMDIIATSNGSEFDDDELPPIIM